MDLTGSVCVQEGCGGPEEEEEEEETRTGGGAARSSVLSFNFGGCKGQGGASAKWSSPSAPGKVVKKRG